LSTFLLAKYSDKKTIEVANLTRNLWRNVKSGVRNEQNVLVNLMCRVTKQAVFWSAGIAGSNPPEGTNVCLLCLLCVQVTAFATIRSFVQRVIYETVSSNSIV